MTDFLYPLLSRIRIVLVETSHPGNVGSVARAVKNMGLSEVVLVNPLLPDVQTQPEAISLASGAGDVLAAMRVVPDLTTALGGCDWAIALSARARELTPSFLVPRSAAQETIQHLSRQPNARIAFVFGNERVGLSNEHVLQCQRFCTVPVNEAYPSLNLSQAVQIISYECRQTALASAEKNTSSEVIQPTNNLVTVEQMEQFYAHLQEALIASGFLNLNHPKKLMPRLRRYFGRSLPEQEEWQLLRGICTSILQLANRLEPANEKERHD